MGALACGSGRLYGTALRPCALGFKAIQTRALQAVGAPGSVLPCMLCVKKDVLHEKFCRANKALLQQSSVLCVPG